MKMRFAVANSDSGVMVSSDCGYAFCYTQHC